MKSILDVEGSFQREWQQIVFAARTISINDQNEFDTGLLSSRRTCCLMFAFRHDVTNHEVDQSGVRDVMAYDLGSVRDVMAYDLGRCCVKQQA